MPNIKKAQSTKLKKLYVVLAILAAFLAPLSSSSLVYASKQCGGEGNDPVKTSIDLGCRGVGNPIVDMLFAAVRFLSIGVGLVIIGSLVVAGIQFTSSRGDPQASANALKRVQTTFAALLLYLFAYAILNYIVPGQLLK
jgi:hypothetical protein